MRGARGALTNKFLVNNLGIFFVSDILINSINRKVLGARTYLMEALPEERERLELTVEEASFSVFTLISMWPISPASRSLSGGISGNFSVIFWLSEYLSR